MVQVCFFYKFTYTNCQKVKSYFLKCLVKFLLTKILMWFLISIQMNQYRRALPLKKISFHFFISKKISKNIPHYPKIILIQKVHLIERKQCLSLKLIFPRNIQFHSNVSAKFSLQQPFFQKYI